MFNFPTWDILGIIAIAFLAISFYHRRNATWACLMLGFIIGSAIAGINVLKDGAEFNWILVKKICIVATFTGAFFDIAYSLSRPPGRRKA